MPIYESLRVPEDGPLILYPRHVEVVERIEIVENVRYREKAGER